MKRSLFLLSILLLALSGCNSADVLDIDDIPQAEVIQDETETPDDYILTSYADNYVCTSQESPDAAMPSSLRIILNGEPLVIDGLEIYGQMYFRMDEIARMLQGTRAEFDFFTAPHWDPTDIDISWRWNFDSSRKFHGIEDVEPVAIEGGVAVPTNVSLRTFMARDGWRSEASAFEVNGDFYFDLNNLGYIIGYIHRIENGIVHIDTMEPDISEYGFIAARDFLSALPTLFTGDWTDEIRAATPPYYRDWWREGNYTFPFSYRLYDFNNDGIPEIIMRYERCADDVLWGIHVLYVYENGDFARAHIFILGRAFHGRPREFLLSGRQSPRGLRKDCAFRICRRRCVLGNICGKSCYGLGAAGKRANSLVRASRGHLGASFFFSAVI